MALLVAYGLHPGPVGAEQTPRETVMGLVQEARALHATGDHRAAQDRASRAAELLAAMPGASARDRAALDRMRLFYGLRAFETAPPGRCDAGLESLSRLAPVAERMAADSGDDRLRRDVAHLAANVQMLAGDYRESERLSRVAHALGRGTDPCGAAMSRQVGAQALLYAREAGAARQALTQADAALLSASCPTELRHRQTLLRARTDVLGGSFVRAEARLDALLTAADTERDTAATALFYLAEMQMMRGLYAEAELLNDRAGDHFRSRFDTHPVLAQIAHRGAIIRQELGDWPAAEAAYARALAALECRLGAGHPSTLNVGREYALLLSRMGRHDAAMREARRAQSLGAGSAQSPYEMALNAAARGLVLQRAGGRTVSARLWLERGLDALRDHSHSAVDQTPALLALSQIALAEGDPAEARDFAARALGILEETDSRSILRLGEARRLLAAAHMAAGSLDAALALADRTHAGILAQVAIERRLATYTVELRPAETRRQIGQRIALLWRTRGARGDAATADAIFASLQALSLSGGLRSATDLVDAWLTGRPDLAALVDDEWRALAAIGGLERVLRRDPADMSADSLRRDILRERDRLASIRARLRAMPDYPAFRQRAEPSVTRLADAQARLGPQQALWLHGTFDSGSYVLLLRRDDFAVARTALGPDELNAAVSAIRRQVDLSQGQLPKPGDFPVAAAYDLYCRLFAPLVDPGAPCAGDAERLGTASLAPGQDLLVMPDHALQTMPVAMLLTEPMAEPADFDAFRSAPWFFRRNPSTTLVSTAAFAGGPDRPPAAAPARRFVGFAPFGPFGPDRPCRAEDQPRPEPGMTVAAAPGSIDPSHAFRQSRLPMTVEMVEAVADRLDAAPRRDWFDCETATEAQFKAQDMTSVDTLLLATHAEVGALPPHLPEPGIYMAAPARGSAIDDGYIRASEIAQASISARLVVLSACSTASHSGLPGAPGLTGLAQAFFQAGAQTLIVSHWDVASVSSSALFDRLLQQRKAFPDRPASRHLQNAAEAMLAADAPALYAHPFFWAPFVIVAGR